MEFSVLRVEVLVLSSILQSILGVASFLYLLVSFLFLSCGISLSYLLAGFRAMSVSTSAFLTQVVLVARSSLIDSSASLQANSGRLLRV